MCVRGVGMNTNDILDWDQVIQNIPESVWHNVQHINFNGTTGDNLLHPHIVDMVSWTCENTNAFVSVHTNGSLRNTDWWYNFGQALSGQMHRVVFAIDGLDDTHSIYRQNTDWQKIINNARAFINGGGTAEWQFIVFKHNAHQIEAAEELSRELGFSKFFVLYQDRFDSSNTINAGEHKIERYDQDPRKLSVPVVVNPGAVTIPEKMRTSDQKISCRSQRIGWVSIYADGTVWPCCWLMGWHKATHQAHAGIINYHFNKILKIDFDQISLYNSSLEQILLSDLWQQGFPNSFTTQPNAICLQQCSGTKE